MLKARRKLAGISLIEQKLQKAIAIAMEPLENRQFLSVSAMGGHGEPRGHDDHGGPGGRQPATIQFSLAPSVVQTGLDALASADGLSDPANTDPVQLNNVNGVETYSVTINGTGTVTRLTVDQLGDAVTQPTRSTTTWATLNGTGTGSNAAASAEITAIATALNRTAPADTTTINITTTSAGVVTYSIHLSGSSIDGTTSDADGEDHVGDHGSVITVDASGAPVGDEQVPFSVLPAAIQNGLNAAAPTGASALASTSTQKISIRTTDGVVTYTAKYTVSGVETQVTVNLAGTLTSLPTTTTTTFSAVSSTVQAALQTLATAEGVTTTIATTQSVSVLTETNRTVIYSVKLSATDATDTDTHDITIAVDSSGNPTTLPRDSFGAGGNDHGGPPEDSNPSNSSSGTTTGATSNSSSSTLTIDQSTSSAGSTTSTGTYTLTAKMLPTAMNSLGSVGGYFVLFAPSTANAAVKADLATIASDQKTLQADTKALSAADKKTLSADQKEIAAAIKAINAILSPLQKTLKKDVATWTSTIKADQKAIRKDKNDAAALATAQAKLVSDKASAFAAISADQGNILTAISSNSGVTTARAKLANDLPTIAADTTKLQADQAQLTADLEAEMAT